MNYRRLLGIVFCDTCQQDTMPLDRTGECAFCNTKLVEPSATATAPSEARTGECGFCGGDVPPHRRKFCSRICSQRDNNRNRTDRARAEAAA